MNKPRQCTAALAGGQRCGGGPMPGITLCGPHYNAERRAVDADLVLLAAAFGTPDAPLVVRTVAASEPLKRRELLESTQRDIDRGQVHTNHWRARVKRAAATRAH